MSEHLGDAGSPSDEADVVVPSNTTTLKHTRGVFVGTGGTIMVIMVKDSTPGFDIRNPNGTGTPVPFVCQNGQLLPIRVCAIRLTGNTASDIVALR